MAKTLRILTSLILSISVLLILIQVQPATARVNQTEFISEILEGHHAAREAVGALPLKWENKLAAYARAYSKKRRKDCQLIHSAGGFGENMFRGSGKRWSGKDAVAVWAAEKKWYNYWDNSCVRGHQCGRYTQLVWNQTQLVGCAKMRCNSGDTFMICEYYPPGNRAGKRPY